MGLAVALALLISISPTVGALKPHVILPPYKHTALAQSKSIFVGGNCKSGVALNSNYWLPKTGNLTAFAYAAAKGCNIVPTGPGYAESDVSDNLQVGFPVKVYTNMAHNFSVNFSYSYTIIVSHVRAAGGCPTAKNVPGTPTYIFCDIAVGALVSVSMQLFDQTNNSYNSGQYSFAYLPLNYSYTLNSTYCNGSGACGSSNGSGYCGQYNYPYLTCAASGTKATGASVTWINTGSNCGYIVAGRCYTWDNWTLNSSHNYWVLASVSIDASAVTVNYGIGTSAIASINGATLGNTGWKITSVTVT
ncbi:MAG TPA: hypothetical protein VFF67_09985 [Thermoplasmata archaeon]|nr:hypothetical protein [Thermoplasmata archaeon]